MSEFSLIDHYFKHLTASRADVSTGIGDDAAVVQVPLGKELLVSTDVLNIGVHFPLETSPFDIGYKSLAVNLSDMAAMGAVPCWVTLSLSLPEENADWLEGFSRGFAQLANQHQVQLIGGDTTKGPLSISVTIMGLADKGRARLRSAAKPGDLIAITGSIGDAALGLDCLLNDLDMSEEDRSFCISRLNQPTPRVSVSGLLAPYVNAMIDISDGLVADLQHILDESHCGAVLYVEKLPLSSAGQQYIRQTQDWVRMLSGGDDYELCFSFAKENLHDIEAIAQQMNLALTVIGYIESEPHMQLLLNGEAYTAARKGYDHFGA